MCLFVGDIQSQATSLSKWKRYQTSLSEKEPINIWSLKSSPSKVYFKDNHGFPKRPVEKPKRQILTAKTSHLKLKGCSIDVEQPSLKRMHKRVGVIEYNRRCQRMAYEMPNGS